MRGIAAARRFVFALALIAFFCSGFAALVYQVVWQRLLTVFSGADVYSATLVVGAYMAGLGLGSLAGGHLADRVSRRTALLLFCLAELGIALFGAYSASFYYDGLYRRYGGFAIGPAAMGGVLFLGLLWPTCLMGASLPLLSRALTGRIEAAARTIGSLYAVNTLGAAAGAFIATWWFIPTSGLSGSLQAAAALNVGCAAVALPLAWAMRLVRDDRVAVPTAAAAIRPAAVTSGWSLTTWCAVYAMSGLIALSLEIVWFRLLGVMLKATAFTFGTLLAVYLVGLGLGGIAGSIVASRTRHAAAFFLVLQAGVGISAALALLAVLGAADAGSPLHEYFGTLDPINLLDNAARVRAFLVTLDVQHLRNASLFLVLYVGVPLLITFPATFLMGGSFAVLQQVVQTDMAQLGRRVGLLLVANIAGSLAGAVLTGWVALDLLGSAATMRVLVAASGCFALLALLLARRSDRGDISPRLAALAVVMIAVTAVTVAALPGSMALWSRLHGQDASALIVGEDSSGTAAIHLPTDGGRAVVFVHGQAQSYIPYDETHTALGALPAFIHGGPRVAAVIGLGSGATAHAVAGHPAIERVVCIEIARRQLQVLRAFTARSDYRGLNDLLAHPRIEHVFGDGRRYLMGSGQRFDLIEADALRPGSAYSGNLYSEEYFELLKARLNPRGLAVTWSPTRRIQETFLRVFPHVVSLPSMMLGSNEPIQLDRARIAADLSNPVVRAYYERAGWDLADIAAQYLERAVVYGPDFPRESLTEINRDLYPRDEFEIGW